MFNGNTALAASGVQGDATETQASTARDASDDLYLKVKEVSKDTGTVVDQWDKEIKSTIPAVNSAAATTFDNNLKKLKQDVDSANSQAEELRDKTYELKKSIDSTNDPYMRLGPDVLYGLATDRLNQTNHDYFGAGLLLTFLAPTDASRSIEGLAGIYKGKIDIPSFRDDTSTVLNIQRGAFPAFKEVPVWILRAEARLPVGETGFISIAGRFHRFVDQHLNLPDPWTINLGYTIAIDTVLDKLIR